MKEYDVIIIGGGPAGLASAISAKDEGKDILLIEREVRLGGILKQCIHDGFGLLRFNEKLSGPEYAEKYIDIFNEKKIKALTLTFVTEIVKEENGFTVSVVNRDGVTNLHTKTVILATGCRERTARQIFIHGTRPSGIFTAGTAQAFVNIYGQKPTKKCIILGSGDIGLIMARRLTLEGAEVKGVYEAKPTPSGLTRNVHQCLNDYNIPLHLSHTVTRVFGNSRLTAVEVSRVDENMAPIKGTEQIIECDALILSVGLIPENELAETLGAKLNERTKGPVCDNLYMTSVDGLFSCGNALHVNDLVDYVSENAAEAGKAAANYIKSERKLLEFSVGENLLYIVPQSIELESDLSAVTVYFRSSGDFNGKKFTIKVNGDTVFEKKYAFLRPPEMEKLVIDMNKFNLNMNSRIEFSII
ncbi:MAG: FAD-dependent oxidoreductase [Clostridiales bacterium]|nr:FAD-dependent oxidoreductase [Clostridiales bacterium]